MTTAAGIIIGDEILSGKVADRNSLVLAQKLWQRGVELRCMVTIGDDPAMIARYVREFSARYDWVISSGGIGATHDDCTMEGIAQAFDCTVERRPSLERAVRAHLKDHFTPAALKFAEIPAGSELLGQGPFPIVIMRNVFILPGVPQIFARKLDQVCTRFDGRAPSLERIYLSAYESMIASELARVQQEHPDVKIGSYPQDIEPVDGYNLLITIESADASAVKRASQCLRDVLPDGTVNAAAEEA